MLGNFIYHNPTKLLFGVNSLDFLEQELSHYGSKIMLAYGGGSIKKNGIYDNVTTILRLAKKEIVEFGGIMPNPTIEKLLEGAEIVRKENIDFILAVGGGSTIDLVKGVAAAAYSDEDPWEKFYVRQENPAPNAKIVPMGTILTMAGTGSEMNGGSVITNHGKNLKLGKVYDTRLMPRFTILNPVFTFSVPRHQMVSGIFDIMCHILEQYLSGEDDNTSDYIAEGLMKSLIHSSRIAAGNPEDYEARSNIMWTATWALNTLIEKGKTEDWETHNIGHAIGAVTNASHGMTLAAVSPAYLRHIMDYGLHKFVRMAENVWDINPESKTDKQIAEEGLKALTSWMDEIGTVRHLKELGVKEEMLDTIADATLINKGGYKVLTRDEVIEILKESM